MIKDIKKEREIWSQIVTKAWNDENFKKKLVKSPKDVLKEFGLEVDENKTYKVLIDSEKEKHLIVPQKGHELSESQVKSVEGGLGPYCYLT